MFTKLYIHDLANHVRNLLCCSEVYLLIGCSEPSLRHPLLEHFPAFKRWVVFHCYQAHQPSLLKNERLWALCDLAIQTGTLIDQTLLPPSNRNAGSMVIVPLERPAGILGVLLCLDSQPEALKEGEYLLIQQYQPTVARHLEELLSDACLHGYNHLFSRTTDHQDRVKSFSTVETSTDEVEVLSDAHEQNKFISLISHELRVPLTAIKGYAGLLQAFSVTDRANEEEKAGLRMTTARQQQYLNEIMEQTNHLEVLIGDLLDVSRLQAGRLALHYSRVDIAHICQRVTRLIQHRIDQQQQGSITLRCTIAPNIPLAWADPDRVQQVLTNLVENAVKYSPGGGLIEIQAYAISSFRGPLMTCVAVCDQGIGIPRHQQVGLFQPFTRLEHTATRNVAGAGLGLYISRKLVEAMQGHILLQSSEGEGTRITFTLPTRYLVKAPITNGMRENQSVEQIRKVH